MAKSRLRRWLEWAGHVETIRAIFAGEVARTILWPFVVAGITMFSGIFGGLPWMWILMATAVAFAAIVHGLLRGSEYIERKNPGGKLRFTQVAYGCDLVPIPQQNRQQRRAGQQPQFPQRFIDRVQLGIEVHNDASFPLSVIFAEAESEFEDVRPPRTNYPKAAITIPPKVTMRFMDERMAMNNFPYQPELAGKVSVKLLYGLPGKETFELSHESTIEMRMHPSGMITHVMGGPVAEGTR